MHQREVFTTRGLIHNLCSFIGGPTDTLPFRSSFLPVRQCDAGLPDGRAGRSPSRAGREKL